MSWDRLFRRAARFAVACAVLVVVLPAFPASVGATNVPCSGAALVSAITNANSHGGDTLDLAAPCTYTFSAPSNFYFGPNALPAIQSAIVIHGHGATLARSGVIPFRFFAISGGLGGVPAGSLVLDNLTMQGGLAQGGNGGTGFDEPGGGGGMGGAIFNNGTLTLMSSLLTGNQAVGGQVGTRDAVTFGNGGGGGMGGNGGNGGASDFGGGGGGGGGNAGAGSDGGPTNGGAGGPITGGAGGTRDSGNGGNATGFGGGGGGGGNGATTRGGAGGFGGGAGAGRAEGTGNAGFGGGAARFSRPGFGGGATTEVGGGGGGAGMGGAIFNFSGAVTIINSTLTGNTAQGGSGVSGSSGFQVYGGGSGYGGAVFNLNGSVTVTNATLAANTVAVGVTNPLVTAPEAAGGAIYDLAHPATGAIDVPSAAAASVTVQNSILSNSVGGADLVSNQLSGALTAMANISTKNLVMSQSAIGGGTIVGAPVSAADPNLGALTNNGGLTPTMAPSAGSPAIAHGDTTVCARPLPPATPPNGAAGMDQRGLPRPTTFCTIGSYEPQPFAIVASAGTPQQTTVGTAFPINLGATVLDNQSNPLPGYSVTFTAPSTATAPTGTFASGPVMTTDSSGSATAPTFTVNTHPGGYTVMANLTSNGFATPASFSLTNLPGPAVSLTVTGYPSPVVSGTAHSFTVTTLDQYGNTATGYTGTVHMTSTDSHASVPADYPFVSGDAGGHMFSATFGAAGTWSLTATDTATSTIMGTQAGIIVTAAPLVTITVAPNPATLRVGQGQQFTAMGTYADNSTANLTSQVAWSGDAPAIASVDTSGQVTGQSPGTVHIAATLGSVSGQVNVTVSPAIPKGVAPAPAPANRPSGTASEPGVAPAPKPTGR